jgi:hypothetical protein
VRPLAQSLCAVGLGFWVVILILDITGDSGPVQNLAFGAAICWAVVAPLFFISDRRKTHHAPLTHRATVIYRPALPE